MKIATTIGAMLPEAHTFMNKQNGTGPVSRLPLELYQESTALLYKVAKFILETYGVFEE